MSRVRASITAPDLSSERSRETRSALYSRLLDVYGDSEEYTWNLASALPSGRDLKNAVLAEAWRQLPFERTGEESA